ncbi:hypothetical protein IWX90DRAFT_278951 [Phyllosticta citrichinensis]|uniref:Uncharacterized protein n=1 Tax=Phyllosticta citrichinensis TaxID=1130410 RepID=A0ABR1XNE6_9PEZI
MSVFNLNPLAMPFIPTKKDDDRVDSPVRDKLQLATSRVEPHTPVANGLARGRVNYFPAVQGILTNCAVTTEPFPYYADPISGQAFMTTQPLPQKCNEHEKHGGDEEKAARPVDINLVVRLPLVLKLVIVYKITQAKPHRIFSQSIIVDADWCANDIETQVQDVIREDMKESIKNNDLPSKDKNAFSCGRVDFKTKVLKQGADARDQHSFLGPHTCIWFALNPLVRDKLARRQYVDERDLSLRVTVTVFEGFPLRHLLGNY